MPDTKTSTGGGGAGSEFVKGILGLIVIGIAISIVIKAIKVGLHLWALALSGFHFLLKAFLFLLCVILVSMLVALICDVLAPLIRRIKKDREKQRSIASCRLPSLTAFRTGQSELKNEQTGKIDTFLARLLRERYQELTGSLPDRNTFRSATTYNAFKAGELPNAIRRAERQVEQDIFSPLIAAYRTGNQQNSAKEERSC